jgi:quercetin dioxygenase-like cupin family protein
MPGSVEQRLRTEADHCYQWSNQPGARYAVHTHPYRKILYVASGSITFIPEGQAAIELGAGDRLELPAGTPHAAVVGDQGVVCWEGQAIYRPQLAGEGGPAGPREPRSGAV